MSTTQRSAEEIKDKLQNRTHLILQQFDNEGWKRFIKQLRTLADTHKYDSGSQLSGNLSGATDFARVYEAIEAAGLLPQGSPTARQVNTALQQIKDAATFVRDERYAAAKAILGSGEDALKIQDADYSNPLTGVPTEALPPAGIVKKAAIAIDVRMNDDAMYLFSDGLTDEELGSVKPLPQYGMKNERAVLVEKEARERELYKNTGSGIGSYAANLSVLMDELNPEEKQPGRMQKYTELAADKARKKER